MSGSKDSTIKIWDRESGNLINSIKAHKSEVSSVAISKDDRFIASGSRDKTIKIWDRELGYNL